MKSDTSHKTASANAEGNSPQWKTTSLDVVLCTLREHAGNHLPAKALQLFATKNAPIAISRFTPLNPFPHCDTCDNDNTNETFPCLLCSGLSRSPGITAEQRKGFNLN